MHWEAKKCVRLALLQYSFHCSGLEPNLQNLWDLPAPKVTEVALGFGSARLKPTPLTIASHRFSPEIISVFPYL